MARRGLLSWLTGGAVESVRDVPVLGWLVDKVAPVEAPKKQAERQAARSRPKGEGAKRKKVPPKPRITTAQPGTAGPRSIPSTGTLKGSKARDLQIQFSNPFATRAEREKAVRQWLKIHPRPGEASLTPNEMAAFREAYALTETEKW